MDQNLLGLAFGAGLVAALNPCGFAMLPGYLTLVVRGEGTERPGALVRALAATAAMAAGFVAVFGLFGLLTVSVAAAVQRYLPYVTVVVGVALVTIGMWLLMGREVAAFGNPLSGRWAPSARLSSMFGYGVAYALASLSCTIGPFLAVTGASLRSGTAVDGLAVFAAYTAGLTALVGILAVAAAFASTTLVERLRRILPYVNRIGGALLVIVGSYVAYYGVYEIRLFSAGGSPRDPVVEGAARIQAALAGWVYRLGAWPWLVALALLAVVFVAGTVVWRRRVVANRSHR